jgi:hypothetical protein
MREELLQLMAAQRQQVDLGALAAHGYSAIQDELQVGGRLVAGLVVAGLAAAGGGWRWRVVAVAGGEQPGGAPAWACALLLSAGAVQA